MKYGVPRNRDELPGRKGKVPKPIPHKVKVCSNCDGYGEVVIDEGTWDERIIVCPECDGLGELDEIQ